MLLQLLHLAQAGLAAYGGQQSYVAITNLRKYEDASKKLAKVSSEAEHQRQQTYATQASGVAALLLSFLASMLLARRGSVYGVFLRYLIPIAVAAALTLAREHIRGFGAGKTPGLTGALPKMGEYEEAERRTHSLISALDLLTLSWIATWVVALVIGY
ncbi:hypothetical protein GGR54DRAFT_613178 [Hypoxylon sp. NC1633]|nr:hypothetical protein GGR54DRAFT_613178 [Hypoxylon sp. NC1633]